nr:reverse transcriptase [Tanacetum cinerariifolium]
MKEHTLYAKISKCVFGTNQVEYLGHIISKEGVATDPTMIKAMLEWPIPVNLKQMRRFLAGKATWTTDLKLKAVIESMQQGTPNPMFTSFANEQRRKGKLVVGNDENVRLKLINHFYNSAIWGHSVHVTTTLDTREGVERCIHGFHRGVADVTRENSDHGGGGQTKMKSYADKKRSDREFMVGDFVYLKLQPYRPRFSRSGSYLESFSSLQDRDRKLTNRVNKQHKLSSKFYGPFKVLERIGKVAYKLELPPTAQVHPVFHVSQLKKCHSKEATIRTLPLCDAQDMIAASPFKLLDRKMTKQGNRAVVYGLIQLSNGSEYDATWELLTDIEKRIPDFDIDP